MSIEIIAVNALGWLMANALPGVVGNRADAGLKSAYKIIVERLKKGGKPLNYDLQKAVQRSYLQALQEICRECLEELKNKDNQETAYASDWLEKKSKGLEAQLKEVENLEYKEAPVEQFQEIELLLSPEGKLAQDKIKALQEKIFNAAAVEGGAPVLFRKKVKNSLFEYMCGFFASEIKTNPKVRDIFVTHLLVNMGINLEGIQLTVERLEMTLREIADAAREVGKSFLTLEEMKKYSDFKPIFISNYKFVGRSDELNRLEEFLDNDLKVMTVIGEGGIGKTRLVIEFAKKMMDEGDWDVYFVNPDGNPHTNLNRLHGEKILLILDEAGSCTDRDKLIDSVLNNYSKGLQIKLLLIIRPIFRNSIESYLKKKSESIKSVFLEPKKADIDGFLRENCKWINEDTARIINERSSGSFNAAVAIAEYYREKGNIADVQEALSWQAEKYIRDIAIGIGKNPDDIGVASTVRLISLITPVAWEEKEYLSKLPPYIYPIDPESLEKVLRISSVSKGVLSYFPEKKGYAIKPDPIADHLRMELMKNEEAFSGLWKYLFPNMAYRISLNIAVLPKDNSELLGQIWNELNIIKGLNVEYFEAIVFFTGDLEQIIDFNKININQWIKCYYDLFGSSQEKEVREWLAKGLFNSARVYGLTQKFERMEACLQELRELYLKHPDKEMRETLVKGLVNAMNDYGTAQNIEMMEASLQEFRDIHLKHPDKEVREELVKGMVNAVNGYGTAQNIEKMEACLQELRELHLKHPDKEVREWLVGGLYNAATLYGSAQKFEKLESCLQELRELHLKHPDKEMRQKLERGLYNAATFYGSAQKFEKLESCLQELRELYNNHPDKEVKEWLAKGLYNALIVFRRKRYENIVLLYKLRFDLPDDSDMQNKNIKIEGMLVEETVKISEIEYKKGAENLKLFLQKIKADIGDDNDVVLLMDKVAEKLPLKAQKVILETFSS